MQTGTEIMEELESQAEQKYSEFSGSLIPGAERMLGVRIPKLRAIAKRMAREDWREYLKVLTDQTFEELTLQAFVIGYAKTSFAELRPYVDAFVPKIRNWSVNDSFCQNLQIAEKEPEAVWAYLMELAERMNYGDTIDPNAEFTLRVTAITAMSHFLNDTYIDRVLALYDRLHHDGYYLKMGVAWGIATAFAKYPEKTRQLMEHNHLDDDTYNKAIQKMLESFRVSDEDKAVLRTMRRKQKAINRKQ